MSGDILAQLESARSDEEREWLVMRFSLDNMAPAVREAVWAAAIPHWFDADFVAALLDERGEQARELYQALRELSFVEVFPGRGHNLHERSRVMLLRRLWQNDQARYRELSQRAADYCAGQDQSDTGWRAETIYHLLVAEPDSGVDQLYSTGWEWHGPPNFAYDKVEVLARLAREHADAGRLEERGVGWTLFWEALLDSDYSRYQSARDRFLRIQIASQTDPYLTADRALRLGHVHRMLSEYEAAREKYEEALPIYRDIGNRLGEANCIQALGHVHQMLSEYEAARGRYEEALPIYRDIGSRWGEASCIKALGDVHWRLSKYEAARGRYEEALPIYRDIGAQLGEANCIQALGNVHYTLSEYKTARGRYEEALPIYRTIGARLGEANCIQALGDVHQALDEYEAARGRYEEALPIYRDIGTRLGEANCITALGDVHRMLDEYEAARGRYEEALPIYRDIGARLGEVNCLLGLADLDRQNEQWAAAEQKYRQALAYYRATSMAYNAALALRRLGHTAKGAGDRTQARDHYEAALALFTQIGSPRAESVQADLDNLEQD